MDDYIKRELAEKLSVSVAVAGKAFGLSRNAAYAAVKNLATHQISWCAGPSCD